MEATHFIYMVHPPRPTFVQDMTQEERDIMSRHHDYLKDLLDRGKLLVAGPCLDGAFGLGILKVTDAEEARRIAEADPAVATKLMRPELHAARFGLIAG
jgi:uncharacterized protein YciI